MSTLKTLESAEAEPDATSGAQPKMAEIKVKGREKKVPSEIVAGRTLVIDGSWIRIAKIKDEELIVGEPLSDPDLFVAEAKKANLHADLLTFSQRLPNTTLRTGYYHELDNLAVITVRSYKNWWSQLSDAVQRAVKKAQKSGVIVREVPFTDDFVRGIQGIYDETPVRQGKAFWHYRKDFETVKAENGTYVERSGFIGAYFQDELIGFIKMIYVGPVAEISQILSQNKHREKRPTNALIAKAVEMSEQRGITHLVYCNYVYNDPNSSLTEFKRRNRFEPILMPRYYVPLTLKGKIVLGLRLHHGVKGWLPTWLVVRLLRVRAWLMERFVTSAEAS